MCATKGIGEGGCGMAWGMVLVVLLELGAMGVVLLLLGRQSFVWSLPTSGGARFNACAKRVQRKDLIKLTDSLRHQ